MGQLGGQTVATQRGSAREAQKVSAKRQHPSGPHQPFETLPATCHEPHSRRLDSPPGGGGGGGGGTQGGDPPPPRGNDGLFGGAAGEGPWRVTVGKGGPPCLWQEGGRGEGDPETDIWGFGGGRRGSRSALGIPVWHLQATCHASLALPYGCGFGRHTEGGARP